MNQKDNSDSPLSKAINDAAKYAQIGMPKVDIISFIDPEIISKFANSFNVERFRESIDNWLDSLPDSFKSAIETIERFESAKFPGINEGYKRELKMITTMDEAPWGAGQMIAFAIIDGMMLNYLKDKGVKTGSKSGLYLFKAPEFKIEDEAIEEIKHEWISKGIHGRDSLIHGMAESYPTEDSFYRALAKATKLSELIEEDLVNSGQLLKTPSHTDKGE